MITKLFEVRDRATFLPVIATLARSEPNAAAMFADTVESLSAEAFLLRRAGYGGDPLVILTRLAADGRPANCDPYEWGDRTMRVAHEYVQANWDQLRSGDVVDVEYVLGERPAPKASERG